MYSFTPLPFIDNLFSFKNQITKLYKWTVFRSSLFQNHHFFSLFLLSYVYLHIYEYLLLVSLFIHLLSWMMMMMHLHEQQQFFLLKQNNKQLHNQNNFNNVMGKKRIENYKSFNTVTELSSAGSSGPRQQT